MNPRFTRELRAECVQRQCSLGAGGVWLLPALSLLQAAAAASQGPQGSGALLVLAAEQQSRTFSGGVRARWTSAQFVQPGLAASAPMRSELSASVGGSVFGLGLGASLVDRQGRAGERVRYVAANAAIDLGGRAALGIFVQRDLVSGQISAALSLSAALDARQSLGLTAQRSGSAGSRSRSWQQLHWQQAAPDGEGGGTRLAVDTGLAQRATAQQVWQTGWGRIDAGVATQSGSTELRAGASGGLAWLGERLHLARRIDDSFALVQVGGFAGVPVLLENRVVAHTDQAGLAIVAGLRAHELQRISVDPSALPMDAEVDGLERQIVPPARSGLRLLFPVRAAQTLRFRLVDSRGQPLPAGTRWQVDGQDLALPLGYGGLAFASSRVAGGALRASWGNHHCSLRLPALPDVPATAPGDLPDLGTLVCL